MKQAMAGFRGQAGREAAAPISASESSQADEPGLDKRL
jgi:hypothetical protein